MSTSFLKFYHLHLMLEHILSFGEVWDRSLIYVLCVKESSPRTGMQLISNWAHGAPRDVFWVFIVFLVPQRDCVVLHVCNLRFCFSYSIYWKMAASVPMWVANPLSNSVQSVGTKYTFVFVLLLSFHLLFVFVLYKIYLQNLYVNWCN